MYEKRAKRLTADESKQVIEVLGGYIEVANICGITPSAVSQWKNNGIPRARFMFLRERFSNLPIMKRLANF